MKPNLLFPPFFKIIGLGLLVAGLVLWYLFTFQYYLIPFLSAGNNIIHGVDNLTDELFTSLIIIGLLFIGFSRLRNESELTQNLRLKALYWAVLVNCAFTSISLIIGLIGDLMKLHLVEKLGIFYIYFYNSFILLLIFISRFYYLLYRAKTGKPIKLIYFLPHKPYNIIWKIVATSFVMVTIASMIPLFKIDANSDTFTYIFISTVLPFFLLWILSKEKTENEVITSIRLKAMQIAVYINYGLFLIATWAVYGSEYLLVISLALVSVQIIFIIVFYSMAYNTLKKKSLNFTGAKTL